MSDFRRRIESLSGEQRALLAARLGLRVREASSGGIGGPRLVAYVVPQETATPGPAPAELRAYLKERLPDYMVPATFVMLDRLPRTPNHKVDVAALAAPDAATRTTQDSFVAPRDQIEETLARIWADLLGGAKVGVHDNFFEIGGDSILSIQVVARANQAGLRLTPDQLFHHQTIAELAKLVGAAPALTAEQGIVTGPVPLTPIQHWFFEQSLPQPHHWHHQLWLEAATSIDADLLAEAVRRVVLHHDALRIRFIHEESGWRQEHGALAGPVHVRLLNLADLAEPQQEYAMQDAADTLARTTELSDGPLLGVLLARRGGGRPDRVLISIHHLVIDPVSWRPLLDDLCASYAQLHRGQEVALPAKTSSFQAWSAALVDYAGSDRLRAEHEFWLALPGAARAASRIPTDLEGTFDEASAQTIGLALSAEETEVLLETVPSAYRVRVEEVLLTALLRAFGAWTGRPRLLVGVERHGREAVVEGIDLSRTVGWFTSFFPVALTLEGTPRPGDALKSIKEQMHRVPSRGIGYGVLRYLSPDPEVRERLRTAPEPQVIFNYAGRAATTSPTAAVLQPLGVPTPSRGPQNRRTHLLEINAFLTGDRLQLDWTFSANVHRTPTIQKLASSCADALRELIRHCVSPDAGGYTASDFPEAGLDQAELDQLLGKLFS